MKLFFNYCLIMLLLLSCESSPDIYSMVQQDDYIILETDYAGWNIRPVPDRPEYVSISYRSDETEEQVVWYNQKEQIVSPGDSIFVTKALSVLSNIVDMAKSWDCEMISFVSTETAAHYYYSFEFSHRNVEYRILKTDMYEKYRKDCDKPLHDGWYFRQL